MTPAARALLACLALGAAATAAACDDPTSSDATAPRVVIRSPAPDSTVGGGSIALAVVLTDDERVVSASVQVGDGPEQAVSITPGDSVEAGATVQLAPGDNRVVVRARDRAGNQGSAELRVARDAAPPLVRITSPGRDTLVFGRDVVLRGTFSDDAGLLSLGYRIGSGPEQPVGLPAGKQGSFEIPLTLPDGGGTVQVIARDRVWNTHAASVRISRAARLSALSVGDGSTCALDAAGAAFCWGKQFDAEVPAAVSGGLRFTALSNGGLHACGLTAEGAAWCWGWNGQGQLGNGTAAAVSTLRAPVRVAGGQRFRSLSAGPVHTCAVADTGAAYCWGLNASGQLGNGTTADSSVPVPVAGGRAFRAVSAGTDHTCALDVAGAAFCWGLAGGQLGLGTVAPPATHTPAAVVGGLTFETLDVGLRASCATTAASQGYCWNPGSGGRPEPVDGGLSFRSIGMGGLHACGVTPAGEAYCWGANRNGEVGNGTTLAAAAPARVAGGITFRTAEASGGISPNLGHSCGLSTDGIAYCWGTNGGWQLGSRGVDRSAVPVPVESP